MLTAFVMRFVFFFKAEDGIRDGHVTGVQTCALPIFATELQSFGDQRLSLFGRGGFGDEKIGRASCRARVQSSGGAIALRSEYDCVFKRRDASRDGRWLVCVRAFRADAALSRHTRREW